LTNPDKKHGRSISDICLHPGFVGVYIAELLDLPIVLVSPAGAMHTHTTLLGNVFNPSYQPVIGSLMMDPTVFTQRLGNVFNPSYQPVLGSLMMDPTVFTQRLGNVFQPQL
jgi:hypothetical protein